MADRFYVYALIDPRCGRVFYVGKGCGNRMHAHAADVRRGRDDGNPEKQDVIRALLKEGLEPFAFVVDRFKDEVQALALEERLISALSDLANIRTRGWCVTESVRQKRALARSAGVFAKSFHSLRDRYLAKRARGELAWTIAPAEIWGEMESAVVCCLTDMRNTLLAAGYDKEWVDGRPHS